MKSFRYLQFSLILLLVLAQLVCVTHESAHLHDNPQECQIGVVLADTLGKEAHGWEVQLAAVSASMLAAFGLYGCEKR